MGAQRPVFHRVRTGGLLLLAALTWSAPAAGTTITLSTNSSEPGIDAELLDATLDFAVADGGSPSLVLTARNDTADPDAFNLSEIFFNASDGVSGLSLASAVSDQDGDVLSFWALSDSTGQGGATHADGFGIFDFALIDGVDSEVGVLSPGETVVFTLPISGAGPFSMDDFVELSAQTAQDDNIPSFAAAKFVVGTGDVSAFGAFVPEPSTLALLALGLGALAALGRRSRTP